MASKCTCPSCKVMFNPPRAAAGKITCPMCKAKIPVASADARSASRDDEDSPSGGRQTLVVMAVAGLVFFLLAGAGLGMFLLKGPKKDPDPTALASQGGPDTPAPTPVVTPAPIERPGDPATNPSPVTPPAPVERPDPVPTPPPAVDPATAKQVKINAAIDKGMVFLKARLDEALRTKAPAVQANIAPGYVAFMAMTLLECGTPADDPTIVKAAAFIREQAAMRFPKPAMNWTYSLAASTLFLERLGDPNDLAVIKSLAGRLILGQTGAGNWGYFATAPTADDEQILWNYLTTVEPKINLAMPGAKDPTGTARALPPKIQAVPVVRWLNGIKTMAPNETIPGDNSNTQFAMLGLWVSARRGLPVRAPLAMGAEYFDTTQAADGSWCYEPRFVALNRTSMTCAGLISIGLGRGIGRKPNEKNVARGFKFLISGFKGAEKTTVAPVPPPAATPGLRVVRGHGGIINADAGDDLYYLWSLERVALVYGLQKIGDVDWYAWESDVLLAAQHKDGSWKDRDEATSGTCFALLILKRVNVVKDLHIDDNIKKDVNKIVNIKE